jgi:hypothetical protein
MSTDLEDPDPPRSRRTWLVLTVVGVLAAAAIVRLVILPMIQQSGTNGGPPTTAAKPSPPPATVAPPATAPPSAPAPAAASREARPRKKAEAPAAPAAPAAPTTGELHIDSDVPGAMVFLDRQYLGTTPVTARNVPPGSHHLNLTAEGYDGYSEPIEVAAGPADVMIRFKEIRLNETVAVVHKHAMGSCEGRLVADSQGVRYETTNRDDAFSIRFADIETFEVDYLKKNLRIKKRGGKAYNFTTRAENADPLFVFHQRVDKVRQQLMGAK